MVGIMGFADHWISEIAGAPGKDFAFLDIFTTASELAKDLKSRGAEVSEVACSPFITSLVHVISRNDRLSSHSLIALANESTKN